MKRLLLISLCSCSCSTVIYERDAQGSVKVARRDLGRDVQGETLTVGVDEFSYGLADQNESDSWQTLIRSAAQYLSVLSVERTMRNRDRVEGAVDGQAIRSRSTVDTARVREQGRTTRALATERTRQLSIP